MKNTLTNCKACGQEMAKNAKSCPHCGAKNKKPIFTKWWFWVIVVMFVAIIAGAGNSGSDNNSNDNNAAEKESEKVNNEVNNISSVFDGDCGITASAEIGKNVINYPEIKITMTNTTEKEIAAVQFYAVPYDVYGDEIKGWTTQSKLYTDTPIAAGKTTSISYQLIEDSVKTVKLYVYSVFFADGTEWGDKDATTSKILKEAPTIEVEVKS